MTTATLVWTSTAATEAAEEAALQAQFAAYREARDAYAATLIAEDGEDAEYGVKVDNEYGRRRYIGNAHDVARSMLDPGTEGIEWWLIA